MGVLESAKDYLPAGRLSGKTIFSLLTWLIILAVIIILAGVIIFFLIRRLKFNKKIIIFEKIGGRWEPTRKDRAMEVPIGGAGDTAFYLLKHKKHLPTPSLQMGRRIYWVFIRRDGEWINFELADLDEESLKMGGRMLDKEMRYNRTALQKSFQQRFNKKSWISENWTIIAGLGFITMIGVMTWLLFDQWIELAATTNDGVRISKEVIELIRQTLVSMDNLCSGSGIR